MHHRRRCLLTPANTRRSNNACVLVAQQGRQSGQQILRPRQLAGQTVTHPYRHTWCRLITTDHLEVVIKRGHFIHFSHGNIHLFGQRHQVPVMQAAVSVVELVQVLNQQIAPVPVVWLEANQRTDFTHRNIICLAPLEFAFALDTLTHLIHSSDGYCLDFIDFAGLGRMVHGG